MILTGVCAAAMAGFLPLKFIAEVANAGTLAIFGCLYLFSRLAGITQLMSVV